MAQRLIVLTGLGEDQGSVCSTHNVQLMTVSSVPEDSTPFFFFAFVGNYTHVVYVNLFRHKKGKHTETSERQHTFPKASLAETPSIETTKQSYPPPFLDKTRSQNPSPL